MSRPKPHHRNQPRPERSGDRNGPRELRPHADVPKGRYDAPGDGAIVVGSRLVLQEQFRIDRSTADRLRQREVNPKEAFTIRDESGDYLRASLKQLDADGGMAVPYEHMTRSPESAVHVTLACAVLARQRMIFVMQKATELGVACVVPLLTDHSVPASGLEHERANAWPAQVVRAVKQCRRGSVPAVMPPTTFDDFLLSPTFKNADTRVTLDDRSEPSPVPTDRPKRVVLLVGPEGGFSDAERLKLVSNTVPWVLGGRVLRAETAVIVGLTAVQMMWGDMAV